MDTKKLASEIFSVIKEEIHKQLKNKIRNSCDVDIETYSVKRNGVNGFVIEYNHKETELLTKNEMYSALKELDRLTNEQKKKRGWATLNVSYEEINISDNWYPANYVKLPRVISLLDKPCKEFNSLASYMEKFCGKKISMTDLYRVGIGGKRGRVYGEEGSRYYLAHNAKECSRLLEELRKNRGTKDIATTSAFKYKDDVDDWDMECSIRNEVEFSGSRSNICEVTIKTPSGKLKKHIQIGF